MSVLGAIDNGFKDVLHFLTAGQNELQKVQKEAPAVIAAGMKLLQDAVTAVKDAEGAAQGAGLNIVLDAQTVADIKMLVADFKGELQAIGIKL